MDKKYGINARGPYLSPVNAERFIRWTNILYHLIPKTIDVVDAIGKNIASIICENESSDLEDGPFHGSGSINDLASAFWALNWDSLIFGNHLTVVALPLGLKNLLRLLHVRRLNLNWIHNDFESIQAFTQEK